MSSLTGGTTTTASACPGPFLQVAVRLTEVWYSRRPGSARSAAENRMVEPGASGLRWWPAVAATSSTRISLTCRRETAACGVSDLRSPRCGATCASWARTGSLPSVPASPPAGRSRQLQHSRQTATMSPPYFLFVGEQCTTFVLMNRVVLDFYTASQLQFSAWLIRSSVAESWC